MTTIRGRGWLAVALLGWGAVWSTWVWATATRNPARLVQGASVPDHCDGPLIAAPDGLWFRCSFFDGQGFGDKIKGYAKFLLSDGLVRTDWPSTETGDHTPLHVAALPLGGLALDENFRIFKLAPEGGRELLAEAEWPVAGMGVVDGRIEWVEGYQETATIRSVGRTPRAIPVPAPGPGRRIELRVAWLAKDGWHLLWTDLPHPAVDGPIVTELIEGTEAGGHRRVQSLALRPQSWSILRDGRVYLHLAFVAPGSGTLVDHDPVALRTPEGWLQQPGDQLEIDAYMTPRYAPILRDPSRPRVHIDGRWVSLQGDRRGWWLVADGGMPGRFLASTARLDRGFRMMPDGVGGYWVLGAWGRAFVHVDASLTRTDPLSVSARLARLFVDDRRKRTDDLFDDGSGYARLVAFFSVLLLPVPLIGAGVARHHQNPGLSSILARVYLLTLLLGGWWFWGVVSRCW